MKYKHFEIHTPLSLQPLTTWFQCYCTYIAVVVPKLLERIADLMAYESQIISSSVRYKWPGCDENFRLKVANNPSQSWFKVNPGIYLHALRIKPFNRPGCASNFGNSCSGSAYNKG